MDLGSRLRCRQPRGDRSLEEQTEHVAVRGTHFLADDDLERRLVAVSRGKVARAQCAVDPLVVGDREMRQAEAPSRLDEGSRGAQRIEGRGAVAVEVGERAVRAVSRRSAWIWTHSNVLDERLLEEVEVLQRKAGPERNAVERVLRNVTRHAGDLGEQLVDV